MTDGLFARLFGDGAAPDRALVHFLSDRDPRVTQHVLDRAAVRAAVCACAAMLREEGIERGDRVVLTATTKPSFVGWLLGSMAIGAVPVPVPSPTSAAGGAGIERFERVIAHARPRAVIGEERAIAVARAMGADAALVAGSRPPPALEADAVPLFPEPDADAPAFVQYTAGSTAAPKGVVVTTANLRANLEAIGRAVVVRDDDRIVSWLPLYHDMGLVGALLFGLYWDVPLYLSSPVGFVLRPLSWLEAIAAHRGTLSPAPHFAYSLCARKLSREATSGLDLSSWRLALDGAEPVRAENARAFIARFEENGFRPAAYHPVYGLSEATLAVTFPALGEGLRVDRVAREALARGRADVTETDADAVEIVSVGRPLEGTSLEIRAVGAGALLPERRLGEIWVRGLALSPRYVGEEGAARTVLRTGDMGYIADGALFVADRCKDLVIQGGANVYPSDVEAAAADVIGVRTGRVVCFGVARRETGTEDVLVAAEVKTGTRDAERAALPGRLRAHVHERTGVVLAEVVLLDPGSLPLTTSGKLMRRRVRDAYVSGTLTKRGLRRWLALLRRHLVRARAKALLPRE